MQIFERDNVKVGIDWEVAKRRLCEKAMDNALKTLGYEQNKNLSSLGTKQLIEVSGLKVYGVADKETLNALMGIFITAKLFAAIRLYDCMYLELKYRDSIAYITEYKDNFANLLRYLDFRVLSKDEFKEATKGLNMYKLEERLLEGSMRRPEVLVEQVYTTDVNFFETYNVPGIGIKRTLVEV